MKKLFLLLILIFTNLTYSQVNFNVKKIQVNNTTVSTINFGNNSTINVNMEVELSTTNVDQRNLNGFFRIKSFANSTTSNFSILYTTGWLIPYFPNTDPTARGTIYTINFILNESQFENSGGYLIMEWENMVFNISKSNKIGVFKGQSQGPVNPTPTPAPSGIVPGPVNNGINRRNYYYLEGKLPHFTYSGNIGGTQREWTITSNGHEKELVDNDCSFCSVLSFGNNVDLNNNPNDLNLNEYLGLAGIEYSRMSNWNKYNSFDPLVTFVVTVKNESGNTRRESLYGLYNPIRSNRIHKVVGDVTYGSKNNLVYQDMNVYVPHHLGGYKDLTTYYLNPQVNELSIEGTESNIEENSIAFIDNIRYIENISYRWEYREYNPIEDKHKGRYNVTRGLDVTHDSSWQVLGYGKNIDNLQNKLDFTKKGYYIRRIAYFNFSKNKFGWANLNLHTIDRTSDIVLLLNDNLFINRLCCSQSISAGQQLSTIQGNHPTDTEIKSYISREFLIDENKITNISYLYEWYERNDLSLGADKSYKKVNSNQVNHLPTSIGMTYLRVMQLWFSYLGDNNQSIKRFTHLKSNIVSVSRARGSGIAKNTNSADNKSSLKNNLLIYPNPAYDILKIESDTEMFDFDVFDLNGKRFNVGVTKESSNTYSINISSLSSGTYLLRFNEEKHKFIKK